MTNIKLKEYKNPEEIIEILKDRGMTFNNPIRAKRRLSDNNYFFLKDRISYK